MSWQGRFYEESVKVWYFKQPRDKQAEYSKQYSEWRRNKKFFEQKSFWLWLYERETTPINNFTEAQRHEEVKNPVEERKQKHEAKMKEETEEQEKGYPDKTSTETPEDDEYEEGDISTSPTTTPYKVVVLSNGDTVTFRTQEEYETYKKNNPDFELEGDAIKKKKIIYAVGVALGVLTLGVLL